MTQAQLTTTQMGILSEEVYKDNYFFATYKNPKKDFIETEYGTYTIIESISTATDMQALLLKNESTGQFVIVFRGTEGTAGDILSDIMNGFINYNPQIADARDFVNEMLINHANIGLTSFNLTLTGHSLGGMLTQAIGSDLKNQDYTFNAWSSSNLIDYFPSHAKVVA